MTELLLAPTQVQSAPNLLKKVSGVYRRLNSYQDTVKVTSTFQGGGSQQSFKTSFLRPNHWILDFSETVDSRVARCVLWSDGKSNKFWESTLAQKPTTFPDIGIGFGSMAMIAGDFVKIIPALLDPGKINDSNLAEWTALRLMPDSKIDGSDCYRIRGVDPSKSTLVLWIEKKRLLILRIERHSTSIHLGNGKAIANLKPKANPNIPTGTFNFVPSK